MKEIVVVEKLKKQYRIRKRKNVFKNLFAPDYKIVEAVRGIDFNIGEGEAVAFLGPNGAGKTTTIKMMTGLIYPSHGRVRVMGFNPFERKSGFLKKIGLVMGNKMALNWDLSANQSFNLIKNIYGLENDFANNRVMQLAQLLDVENLLDTQIRNLSLGERMKMELIGSILHNPDVLFLDEPTIGLDILTKKKVRNFLREIQKEEGTTLILTSHDIDDIEAVCDRVIIINKGEKVYDDAIKNLTKKYQQNRYLRFVLENNLSEKDIEKIRELATIEEETDPKDNVYLFKTNQKNMMELVNELTTSDNNILDMQIESVPLEDVIADLFRS